jgi:hypothetical protein
LVQPRKSSPDKGSKKTEQSRFFPVPQQEVTCPYDHAQQAACVLYNSTKKYMSIMKRQNRNKQKECLKRCHKIE